MNKGDLVKFCSGIRAFQHDYKDKNPGVVLDIIDFHHNGESRGSATVWWADGSITDEHDSYLKVVNEKV